MTTVNRIFEEQRHVRVGLHDIRVSVREGDPARTPLLLMNGLGASLETFAPFAEALSPETPVIRFDVPGVGRSSKPHLPYRLPMLAWLVAQLLDELKLPRVHVLGISWGGLLAQQFALQHPSRCDRLVLASTCPGMIIPGDLSVLMALANRNRHLDPEYLTKIAPEVYGGEVRRRPELSVILGQGRAPDPVGYLYQQLAAVGWNSAPFLPLLSRPTLILAGDDDPLIPLANALLMNALIPDSRLHIFDDGHLGLMTRAIHLAPIVEAFLNEGERPD